MRFEHRENSLFGEMRQVDPKFGRTHPHADVAKVLGIPVTELDESLPIQSVSTGMWFTMVPFRSLATLQNLNISWHQMSAYLRDLGDNSFFYFVSREAVSPVRHAARAHDFLQRRRSRDRFGRGMLHGMGGAEWRAGRPISRG